MVSKPGATWEYSNSACSFVAALIEKVSGMTFEAFCDELLFEPAGMASATMIGAKGLDLTRVPRIARGVGFTGRPKEYAFAYGNQLSWGYRGCGGVRVEHGGGVLGVATHYLRHLDPDFVVALACTYEPKTQPEEIADRLGRIVERQP